MKAAVTRQTPAADVDEGRGHNHLQDPFNSSSKRMSAALERPLRINADSNSRAALTVSTLFRPPLSGAARAYPNNMNNNCRVDAPGVGKHRDHQGMASMVFFDMLACLLSKHRSKGN